MRRARNYVGLALLLATASCGGSDTDNLGTNPGVNTVTNGIFTATVNGTAWSAIGRVIVSRPGRKPSAE